MMDGHQFRMFSPAELRQQREYADAKNAATEEGHIAFSHAEKLCLLLDRYAGDWGDNPEAVAALGEGIAALVSKVRALLGEPRATR